MDGRSTIPVPATRPASGPVSIGFAGRTAVIDVLHPSDAQGTCFLPAAASQADTAGMCTAERAPLPLLLLPSTPPHLLQHSRCLMRVKHTNISSGSSDLHPPLSLLFQAEHCFYTYVLCGNGYAMLVKEQSYNSRLAQNQMIQLILVQQKSQTCIPGLKALVLHSDFMRMQTPDYDCIATKKLFHFH
jgi:hypothetical protein